MRITVVLLILVSSIMIAEDFSRSGIEGDAFVNGSSSWTGYFTVTFVGSSSGDTLHTGTYSNNPPILPDYVYDTFTTCDMYCTLYFSNGWVRAYKNYFGIVPSAGYTTRHIYFRAPIAIQPGMSGGVSTETPVFGPEPLSLGGATWAEIKALDF
ncbi:MAG: hypothetical protein K8S62_03015 [Candidatus Sabulitectum sp.]|nr:hypothetical protein [Candidatus Sabulitectum sp.]